MSKTSHFFENTLRVVRLIPYGRITTYGAIARYLSTAKAARMVGWALHSSKYDESVPAHRVVNSKGILSGKIHFHGINLMQQLLENEGAIIQNNQIVNFEALFWDPSKELNR